MKTFFLKLCLVSAAFAPMLPLIAEETSHPSTAFVAKGNEPFWNLEIGDGKIEFRRLGAEDMESMDLSLPEPLTTDQTKVYVTALDGKPVTIVITRVITADSMSGMQFPFEVVMLMRGEVLRGVGGNPADLLVGEWSAISLAGEEVLEDAPVTLEFESDGRISGKASCNRYGGAFELTGEGLNFEPLVATRMMCEEARMAQELRFFALMDTVTRFEVDDAGSLTLLANDEPVIQAKRAAD